MVIINAEPWTPKSENEADNEFRDEERRSSKDSSGSKKDSGQLFAIHDLANDYIHTFSEKGRPKICRMIWAVLLVTVIGISAYLIVMLLQDFFMYNSFNQSTTVWRDNLTLPAISICSTNYVNYTALEADLSSTEKSKELLGYYNDFAKTVAQFDKRGNIMYKIDIDQAIELVAWENDEGFLNTRFKNDVTSLLVGESDYTFQGWGRKITNLAKVAQATELGACLELNDKGNFIQLYAGVNGGLSFDIDANVRDYLTTTATKGFVLFIRDQDETVMMNSGGYVIAPGTENFVKLSAKTVTRLGGNYGTCENVPSQYARYGTHSESIRECVQRQKISAMLDECQCLPWYVAERLYNSNKTDVLDEMVQQIEIAEAESATDATPTAAPTGSSDTDDTDSSDENESSEDNVATRRRRDLGVFNREIRARQERQADGGDDPTPTPTSYTTSSTPIKRTEPAPAPAVPLFQSSYKDRVCGYVYQTACDAVLERFIKRGSVLQKCPEPCAYKEWDVDLTSTVFPPTDSYLQNIMKFKGKYATKPPTFDYARENIARIHIYYDDIKIEEINQEAAYDWASFVGELGGIGDLFVGFSFFTLFQLIEILIANMFRCIHNTYQKKKKKEEEKAANVEVNEIAFRELSVSIPRDTESDLSQIKTENCKEENKDEDIYEIPD